MQPYTQYSSPFPSPIQSVGTPMPPVRRPLRRLLILTGIGVAVLAVALGGFLLWMKLAARHAVLVDNGNDFAVRASGPKGWTESASLDMPEAGWGAARTAVYNVGGISSLAIVTMTYGSVPGAPAPLVEISKTDKLQLLPAGSYGDIDEPFPSTVKSKRRGEYVQRVCHLVEDGARVGCPNS
jgi:hypothetical protein